MRAILYAVPVAVALVTGVLCAQQDTPSVAAKKDAAARRLIEVSGGASLGAEAMAAIDESFARTMSPEFNAYWKDHRETVDPTELIELMIPIYSRRFSLEELEAVVAFHSSPVGIHLNSESEAIQQEIGEIGYAWGEELGRRVVKDFLERANR